MGELADALKDLKINNAEYYESVTGTASDEQGDPTRDPKKVTHTSNSKGKVTDTNNGNYEQKLMSNWTLTVIVPTMNLKKNRRIVPIVTAPQMILAPETK